MFEFDIYCTKCGTRIFTNSNAIVKLTHYRCPFCDERLHNDIINSLKTISQASQTLKEDVKELSPNFVINLHNSDEDTKDYTC